MTIIHQNQCFMIKKSTSHLLSCSYMCNFMHFLCHF